MAPLKHALYFHRALIDFDVKFGMIVCWHRCWGLRRSMGQLFAFHACYGLVFCMSVGIDGVASLHLKLKHCITYMSPRQL